MNKKTAMSLMGQRVVFKRSGWDAGWTGVLVRQIKGSERGGEGSFLAYPDNSNVWDANAHSRFLEKDGGHKTAYVVKRDGVGGVAVTNLRYLHSEAAIQVADAARDALCEQRNKRQEQVRESAKEAFEGIGMVYGETVTRSSVEPDHPDWVVEKVVYRYIK